MIVWMQFLIHHACLKVPQKVIVSRLSCHRSPCAVPRLSPFPSHSEDRFSHRLFLVILLHIPLSVCRCQQNANLFVLGDFMPVHVIKQNCDTWGSFHKAGIMKTPSVWRNTIILWCKLSKIKLSANCTEFGFNVWGILNWGKSLHFSSAQNEQDFF